MTVDEHRDRLASMDTAPWPPRRWVAAVTVSALLASACGSGSDAATLTFDEPVVSSATSSAATSVAAAPPTTSPTSASSTTALPKTAAEWVDVTANLVGLDADCGNLSHVSARPDSDMLIAGVAGQGLWAATDGAHEWVPLGQGAGSAFVNNRATSIIYDPADPQRFWESGSYGNGVFETRDGGVTFDATGVVAHSDLVSVDFTDPNRSTLLSGTHEAREINVSRDGGRSWEDISGGLPANIGFTSYPLVVNASTYVVGTRFGRDSEVFRTTDGGTTWSSVYAGGVTGAPLLATDGRIYWLLEHGGGLITSSDGGATWTEIITWGPVGGVAGSLVELLGGRFATLGPSNVLVSADQGKTWQAIGPNLPYQPSGMTFSTSRHAFYVWRFYCDHSVESNPVVAESIMRLDVDLERL